MSFDWLSTLLDLRSSAYVLVTIIEVKGSVPRGEGTRMIIDARGVRHGTLGGGNLERLATERARQALGEPGVIRERYPLGARAGQCCGGSVEVMMESVVPAPRVVIFGVGHVGQALVRVLAPTRFEVVVVDDREEWLAALPPDVTVFDDGWDLYLERGAWGPRTYAVIMTHNHQLDADILEGCLGVETAYVGLIGSKTKWARTRDKLSARGITEAQLDGVHCPIGLYLGGKEPGDIAVSVAAELMGVFHGRQVTTDG